VADGSEDDRETMSKDLEGLEHLGGLGAPGRLGRESMVGGRNGIWIGR
jgi:hypothetical protein